MAFTKMHGLGNDFIVVNCLENPLSDPSRFAAVFCDRRFGIGADQLILLYPSEKADFKMLIYNADGGEVEMCGNGIRCLAKYIWDRKLSEKKILNIETLAGIIKPEMAGDMVRVDMGEPVFEPSKIPVAVAKDIAYPVKDYSLVIEDRGFRATFVSMGNPHAVIFIDDDLEEFPISKYGPLLENHPIFPNKANIEFVNAKGKDRLVMRVWERGSGQTLACGTGASATGVAGMLKGLSDKTVTVSLSGGDLIIEWAPNNHVYMTGPAVEVFEGQIRE
ncbi:MAG: diaminopimelate epimerase [Nitrospirae bacterium]|nr:diaminopimelate epimerase [Nitrospirota bacterium]